MTMVEDCSAMVETKYAGIYRDNCLLGGVSYAARPRAVRFHERLTVATCRHDRLDPAVVEMEERP
jgi:hypothetical protein